VTPIPLVDLQAQHREIADEVAAGFARVIERTAFVLGEEVAAFEAEFARFSEVAHCIAVANGTDALELVLRAAGIGPGDEVVVPANTFIATALAVARAGATPVLADCDPVFHLLDAAEAERRIGPRTRALLPVHLYGQAAPVDALAALAARRGLVLIEDAAQAQGARRNGRGVATAGLAAGTSFYPGKNLGAYGDGGAVLTGNPDVARKIRALRNYGSEVKYEHPETGFNSRLDTLQAVVLRAKLARLAAWNAARRAAAARYDALLARVPDVRLPATAPGNEHVWHLYVVRVPRRDAVLQRLTAAGIGAGVHYPVPIHLQGAFRHLGHGRGDFPVAEAAAGEILSLPMFPGITPAQQERVASALAAALA
jgi:dTDP-4-amino-4,6-dideoxygalactose transaminase